MNISKTWLGDFINLLYPETCAACNRGLQLHEEVICLHCRHGLPQTNFHHEPDNHVAKHFWGKLPIQNAAAFYYFTKGSKVQNLIHNLKYHGQQEVGVKIGEMYGKKLLEAPAFQDIELIVPVPLHPTKKKRRGYNQSDVFAEGLSKTMNVPWSPDALQRVVFSNTQTRKDHLERWENVENIFEVADAEQMEGKHILLVDDVVTTGSTLEACARQILEVENTRLSIVTLACASHL
ncbi:MAG: ComF family protein [Chitinophagales bacterium]